ncbi:MAG: class I SAM-dependent methyltransferase [Betaproteobacteria bacterium]|nr:class I SAM-dependent methyltransferase [Betaproteobacteria bacterium]
MGINAELVRLVADLRSREAITGASVIEIGAQDVCVAEQVVNQILVDHRFGLQANGFSNAADLYRSLGFDCYKCIDASGQHGALVFDLNKDLREHYGFVETFDLVTNLGTAEHCFNQFSVFKNLHDLCRPGGIVIHALPAQGNVNHGFYNYHPRFFGDLAIANGYEIVDLSFTVDYKSEMMKYSKAEFQRWDSHDILFYATLRKISDAPFCAPFDGMFSSASQVTGYVATDIDPLVTEFSPYLKGGDWENTKGMPKDGIRTSGTLLSEMSRRLFSRKS